MFKIQWAPLNTPLRRRMQTLVVGIYMLSLFIFGLYSYLICGLVIYFGNIYLKALFITYVFWILYDKNRIHNCNRGPGVRWMRDSFFGRQIREYFPVELVKTAELHPNKNYLLACFPHGVISFGFFTNMCSDITKWNALFPKVRVHLATLGMHFNSPFWREVIRSWGMISVGRDSLLRHLKISNDPDAPVNSDGYCASAVAVIVGGSEEALDARPGNYVLTLKNRKGFIKVAMQSGAAIVPVFSFGENDLFDQIKNPPQSKVRKIQNFIKEKTGIPPLMVLGRGFFQYSFGLIPQRKRIVQVVGSPIDVPQCSDPEQEVVEKYHRIFMESLNSLFETHKRKYIENADEIKLSFK
ncbi:diacylglycerol O-acyltransferase 2-like isoform X2 [Eupeodes corollae]|uniref:diacylglycerol O-acyltransferase 2-like isoform X2 n=1 Tax=Eupeodes corollae TaxID=290404 RepID=UPI002492A25B|nr:diacylglycerol O-acyltransferase 2-like isoform X2 [Eupeodes corollae]XP_055917480.1 diacylglycerol O-acyltransferase 2-like isoform X2 [Eupeodes corollae]